MNMFRDIATVVLFAFGLGLIFSSPADWPGVGSLPSDLLEGLIFIGKLTPFPSVLCFVVSLALFMTRLKY
jgi:hypothetical protein